MDQAILLYLLLGLVVILLLARRPLKRYLNAKAEAAGRRMGVSLEDKVNNSKWANSAQHRLGRSLVFSAGGQGVVAHFFESAKHVAATGPGEWNLAFASPEDIQLVWEPDGAEGGGVVGVRQSIDFADGPIGDLRWMKLVKGLEAAAAKSGVTVERREGVLVKRETPGGDPVWVRQP